MTKSLSKICMAIWFAMYGIFAVTNITILWGPALLGLLALVVAVLLFCDR